MFFGNTEEEITGEINSLKEGMEARCVPVPIVSGDPNFSQETLLQYVDFPVFTLEVKAPNGERMDFELTKGQFDDLKNQKELYKTINVLYKRTVFGEIVIKKYNLV
jgi:hypothetical protein